METKKGGNRFQRKSCGFKPKKKGERLARGGGTLKNGGEVRKSQDWIVPSRCKEKGEKAKTLFKPSGGGQVEGGKVGGKKLSKQHRRGRIARSQPKVKRWFGGFCF